MTDSHVFFRCVFTVAIIFGLVWLFYIIGTFLWFGLRDARLTAVYLFADMGTWYNVLAATGGFLILIAGFGERAFQGRKKRLCRACNCPRHRPGR